MAKHQYQAYNYFNCTNECDKYNEIVKIFPGLWKLTIKRQNYSHKDNIHIIQMLFK